ncbi:hypothetical protein [Nostoc sp. 'Peltigera membranacea cyanobiont' N6]|nr:hypothetical protein [Nostoc sp. 'Peltigera membranacea cyanobiont' N6]
MKFKLASVWVVEDFPVRLLCDRLLPKTIALSEIGRMRPNN